MNRLIDEVLYEWKQQPLRLPMVLHGAPMCGKTYAAELLGKEHFESGSLRIDCGEGPEIEKLFKSNQNLGGMFGAIEQKVGKRIDFSRTLLILDNFDKCPITLRAVRDLYQQRSDLFVVLVGNMSSSLVKQFPWLTTSFAVHRMYPLCFAEFLAAIEQHDLADIVLGAPVQLSAQQHDELWGRLRDYLVVGGMPEVVASWVQKHNMPEVRKIQQEILKKMFQRGGDADHSGEDFESVMRVASRCSGSEVTYQHMSSNLSQSAVKHIFDGLHESGIVHRVYPSTPDTAPAVNHKVKRFKTIFQDVGLLEVLSGTSAQLDQGGVEELRMYQSALFDQFIGQELLLAQSDQVQYWASSVKESTSRVNYLIRRKEGAWPAVLRSEDMTFNNYSLDICLGSYPECEGACVFSTGPFEGEGKKGKLKDFPLYFAMAVAGGYSSPRFVANVQPTISVHKLG